MVSFLATLLTLNALAAISKHQLSASADLQIYKLRLGFSCICVPGETFSDPYAKVSLVGKDGQHLLFLGVTEVAEDVKQSGMWKGVFLFPDIPSVDEADLKLEIVLMDKDGGLRGSDDLLGRSEVSLSYARQHTLTNHPIDINEEELIGCKYSSERPDSSLPCKNVFKPEIVVDFSKISLRWMKK